MNIKEINIKLQYEKYVDPNFDWDNITMYIYDNNLNNSNFIDIFANKINWYWFCRFNKQLVNDLNLCEKYKNKINWHILSSGNYFSLEFCKQFYKKIDWYKYCEHNQLTIEMLFEFAPTFNNDTWVAISKYQKNLTKQFLDEYYHKISLKLLKNNQGISKELKYYFIDKYWTSAEN